MRRTGVCEINSHVMGGRPLGAIPPHPQINVDELCERRQVLAKQTVIRCLAHDSTPSTTLNEGCGAQAYERMELSEMAVFFANTGLGLESHRVHVMGQARVMLIVMWEAA